MITSINEFRQYLKESYEELYDEPADHGKLKERRTETEAKYNVTDLADVTRLINDIVNKNIDVIHNINPWVPEMNDHDYSLYPPENLLLSILYHKFDTQADNGPGAYDEIYAELDKRNIPYKDVDLTKINSQAFLANYVVEDDEIYLSFFYNKEDNTTELINYISSNPNITRADLITKVLSFDLELYKEFNAENYPRTYKIVNSIVDQAIEQSGITINESKDKTPAELNGKTLVSAAKTKELLKDGFKLKKLSNGKYTLTKKDIVINLPKHIGATIEK